MLILLSINDKIYIFAVRKNFSYGNYFKNILSEWRLGLEKGKSLSL